MKNSRILSQILTLTMLISCFASLSVVNVSAHENIYTFADFDDIEAIPTPDASYVEGTSNLISRAIEVNTGDGKVSSFGNHAFVGMVIEPVNENDSHGNALKLYAMKDWKVGEDDLSSKATGYLQSKSYVLRRAKFTNSLSLKFSFYANNTSGYRTIRFNGNNSPLIQFYPGSGGVYVGGQKRISGAYTPNTWYDIELLYNLQTKYFEFTMVDEDGNLFGKANGISGLDISTVEGINFLYSNTLDKIVNSHDQIMYIDDIEMKSIDKLEPAQESESKPVLDFEKLQPQALGSTAIDVGETTLGTWKGEGTDFTIAYKGESYDGSTALVFDAPVYTGLTSSTINTVPNNQRYPLIQFTPANTYTDTLEISMKINMNSRTGLFSLVDRHTSYGIITQYDAFTVFGSRVKNESGANFALASGHWYDMNIKVDLKTGYYKGYFKSLTNPEDPTKNTYFEGYADIANYFGTDGANRLLFWGSRSNFSFIAGKMEFLFDDFYYGPVLENEEPTASIADATAAATADASATASVKLPFASYNYGHYISADLTVDGAASLLNLDNTSVDISSLEAGTYPVSIKLVNSQTPVASVMIDGVDFPVTLTALPTTLSIIAPAGEGNSVSLKNVSYEIMYDFEIVSDELFKNTELDEDVIIEFANPLSSSVSADNFIVYKPNGSLGATDIVSDSAVTISDDRKSVSISFAKENDKHYHIAVNSVSDKFANVLTDYVEIYTVSAPQISDMEISIDEDIATASFKSTGKTGNIFFAIGIFKDGELVNLVPENVELSERDIEKEYKISIDISQYGGSYTVKAFRWDSITQNPYESSKPAEVAVRMPLA